MKNFKKQNPDSFLFKQSTGFHVEFSYSQLNGVKKLKEFSFNDVIKALDITLIKVLEFLEKYKYDAQNDLLNYFQKDFIFSDTYEKVDLNDALLNFDFFGISLSKKQIVGKLKRGTFEIDELNQMLIFFEANDEIIQSS